jgi:hypothetical protein
LILPPDQATETSGSIATRAIRFLKKNFFGNYYDKKMLEKYESDTIVSMFYELDFHQYKSYDFETISTYFYSVLTGLHTFFKTSEYYYCKDTVI